jgi:hypothetical protein
MPLVEFQLILLILLTLVDTDTFITWTRVDRNTHLVLLHRQLICFDCQRYDYSFVTSQLFLPKD